MKSWQTYQYRLFSCSSWEALVRPLISGKEYNYRNENMTRTSQESSSLTLTATSSGQTDFCHSDLGPCFGDWLPAPGETNTKIPISPPAVPASWMCPYMSVWIQDFPSQKAGKRTANVLHCSSAAQ